MKQYTVKTNRGETLVYADSPHEAAETFTRRLPGNLNVFHKCTDVAFDKETHIYAAGNKTTFSVTESHEGE